MENDEIGHDEIGFDGLGLSKDLLEQLATLGYEEPTPIQSEAIPPMIEGRDVLGQAATGTGKTAAFALPIIERLSQESGRSRQNNPAAMVLVPTRELAMQVSEAVHRYGKSMGVRVVPIYGGQPITRQLGALKRGTDVVVATPGRAIDHLGRGTLVLDDIRTVVLDEADEMLDMGFAEDLDQLLTATPSDRQTVLFSATLPRRIKHIADSHMTDPIRIEIKPERPDPSAAPKVREVAYVVPRSHKAAALGRILDVEAPTATIVFCRTRVEVDQLTETLNGHGYRAAALHGGMNQQERDRVMARVRSGTAELLVATDVAARGLDIDSLSHVVNYDLPSSPEIYVHRIGRVGRAGREGVAVTLVEPRQRRMLKSIERETGRRLSVERVPTVADLRSKRLETIVENLRRRIEEDDLDRYSEVVNTLVEDHDLVDVALAALQMVDELTSRSDEDQTEIPDGFDDKGRKDRDRNDRGRDRDRGDRGDRWEDRGRDRDRSNDRGDRDRDRGDRGDRRPKRTSEGMTRIFINAGHDAGIRPGDLVGAIAGETSLNGSDVGSIDLKDRFSLVEVPEKSVNEVISALKSTTIKGRKVNARRERY